MEIQLFHFLRLAFLEPPGRCAPRGVRRLFPEGLDADVGADAKSDPGDSRVQDSGRKCQGKFRSSWDIASYKYI